MKWHYLDPDSVNPKKFGLDEIWVLKCGKFTGDGDVRSFRVRGGWDVLCDRVDKHPVTEKKLKEPQWWLFAAKGE